MKKLLESLPWFALIGACLTLGLAPFNPPHFLEKSIMLSHGNLIKASDWFDFLLHGTPWFLLVIKLTISLTQKSR